LDSAYWIQIPIDSDQAYSGFVGPLLRRIMGWGGIGGAFVCACWILDGTKPQAGIIRAWKSSDAIFTPLDRVQYPLLTT